MTHYAALDVSLRSVAICIIDNEGAIRLETSVPSEIEDITAVLDSFDGTMTSVGLEAGVLTQYLTYGLQSTGYEVICMEARQVKAALSAMRNKTDKNDARGIAQILRSGWYSRVHVKSMRSHEIRALLSSRRAVLSKCTDLEQEVRGLFKVFGIKLPPRLGHGAFDKTVRPIIEADQALAHALEPLLEARMALYKSFRSSNRALVSSSGCYGILKLVSLSGSRSSPQSALIVGQVAARISRTVWRARLLDVL